MDEWRGIPEEYRNQIITGDARELAKRIPDESVDLIFTDPVYDRIDDYRWLAETAKRVLRPDSACLVWCGIGYLPETIDALIRGGLSYRWQNIWYQNNRMNSHADIGFCVYSPMLWMDKGNSSVIYKTNDVVNSPINGSNGGHKWNKSIDAITRYISVFTNQNAIIFDPFTGGGTVPAVCKMLGRNWIAFEIDPEVAEKARERVRLTQPPLFVLQPEQIEMFGGE